jgi:lactate dehydrogenase-like 2-hydroxyacid dehydrogenase
MSKAAKILSLGAIMPIVDEALDARFEVFRDTDTALDEIIGAHGDDIRAIVTRGRSPTNEALMARLPKLELIANFGVGYDSIDAAAAARRGIVVTNTPDVLNDEMGDFTVGLLLATVRALPQAERHLRAGHWLDRPFPLGNTLRGRSIGIAGMGRIGRVIAKRLSGFDVPISYHARNRVPDIAYRHYPDLKALAAAVDVLIVVLPGGAATRNIVDAEILKALGPDGILINVARGSVVDEPALIQALRDKTILAAGIDVFAAEPHVPAELIAMDHVVLVPHVGTATHHTRALMANLVIENITSWFSGHGAVTPVVETPQRR